MKEQLEKDTDGPRAAQKGGFQAFKDRIIEAGNTEAYQPWTKAEDEQLIRESREGRTTQEMAEIHKRTPGAVRSRLKKLEGA